MAESEVRSKNFQFRITPSDKDMLEELARELKISQSNVVLSGIHALAWSMGIGKGEMGDSTC